MKLLLPAAAAFTLMAAPASAQDIAAGERAFKKCQPCHAVGPNAPNKIGPELNGLDGRKSGSVQSYSYSDANKKAGITWNEATFSEYIQSPMQKVPGTKMAFAGIRDGKEIHDLWAYLKQFKADGSKK